MPLQVLLYCHRSNWMDPYFHTTILRKGKQAYCKLRRCVEGTQGITKPRLRLVPWFYIRNIFAEHSPECATYSPHHGPTQPTTLHTPQCLGRGSNHCHTSEGREPLGMDGMLRWRNRNLLICSKLQIALEMQLKIQGEKMELLNAFSYLGRPQCLTQFAIWSCVSCIKLAPLFLYNWGLNLVYIYFICLTHCRY